MMRYGRGRVRLARKHPQEVSLAQWMPAVWLAGVLAGGVLAAGMPVLRVPYLVGMGLYLAVVLGYSLRIAVRHGVFSLLTAPLAFLAVHAGLGAGTWQEMVWGQRRAGMPAADRAVESAASPPRSFQ
jgi:hypothetical protein